MARAGSLDQRAEVTDDGGGADPAAGTGLVGVERRLGTFDGILAVSGPPGGPTIVVIEVPCELSSPRTYSCCPSMASSFTPASCWLIGPAGSATQHEHLRQA